MARTWTLFETFSLTANYGAVTSKERALTNAAGNLVYFTGGVDFLGYRKIYKWDGVTLTDISGLSFDESGGAGVVDICLFNDELFAGYSTTPPAPTAPATIYKYSGSGTSWTLDYTLPDEAAGIYGSLIATNTASELCIFQMDCDDTYLCVAGESQSPTGPAIMFMRTTGGTWSLAQMPGSVYPEPQPFLVGLSKGSRYSKVIALNLPGASDYRTIERGSPTPWANLAGANIGDKRLIGYADGKSFFTVNVGGSTWELKYSTDWGINLTAAGGLTQTVANQKALWYFADLGDGAIMLAKKTDQAYTWDATSDTFVTDGLVGSGRDIQAYFVLNGILYALCRTGGSNEAEVWEGGPVASAGFYYGRGGLQYRSPLPFPMINIGGLAVPYPYAVLGSGASAGQMVAYAEPGDNYESFTDFTGGLSDDPIQAFDTTPWGDAQGAEESGEDAGPGGNLSGGKC